MTERQGQSEPRKRYPSDHRRWFRMEEAILHDARLRSLGNDGLACWARILAVFNWRKAFGGKTTLDPTDIQLISGKRRRDVALTSLQRLADVGLISLRREGDFVEIHIANWAKSQGFTPPELQAESNETPPTTTTPTSYVLHPKERARPKRAQSESVPQHALEAAQLLADLVRERRPGARIPKSLTTWAKSIAGIDASPERVLEIIRWLYSQGNEGEFRIEVQSGDSLATKWGKILAAMERAERPRRQPPQLNASRNPNRVWEERRRAQGG